MFAYSTPPPTAAYRPPSDLNRPSSIESPLYASVPEEVSFRTDSKASTGPPHRGVSFQEETVYIESPEFGQSNVSHRDDYDLRHDISDEANVNESVLLPPLPQFGDSSSAAATSESPKYENMSRPKRRWLEAYRKVCEELGHKVGF